MAKAIIGHLQHDQRLTAQLAAENLRLRRRVAELESLTVRLLEENDRLTAAQAAAILDRDAERRDMASV